MVLTFRNTHDWFNHSPDTLAAAFESVPKANTPSWEKWANRIE